jgi:hypothetical protein
VDSQLNTLLITLYVFLTDRVLPDLGVSREHRPGRRPVLTDAELLCLAAAQHLLGISSEARWVRYARAHLAGMFPHIPAQPGYNKRIRAAGPLIAAAVTALARDVPSWNGDLRLMDSTPVPCGASRETTRRSALAGDAGYGYCRSHHRYYWGLRLHLAATPEGMPVIWGLARPGIGEREATAAILDHDRHLVASGQVFVADKGYAGAGFERFITEDLGAALVRPDRRDEKPRFGSLGGIRQWIESVFDTLKGQLTLEQHGGRTLDGIRARVASRLLALAAAIWHNWRTGAPRKRSLTAYDH